MNHLFQCSILTPMFLSGADKAKPEFRIPPFKGAMRYWWRAAQRAEDVEKLKNNEAALFGAADNAVGASKFKLQRNDDSGLSSGKRTYMLPHGNRLNRPYIQGEFSIRIMGRDPAVLDTAAGIFELSAILGGVGKRTRRGFGTFYLRQEKTGKASSLGIRTLELLKSLAPQAGYSGQAGEASVFTICPEQSRERDTAFRYPAIEEIKIRRLSNVNPKNSGRTNNAGFYPDEIKGLILKTGSLSSSYKHHHGNALGGGDPRLASPVCISFYHYQGSDYLVTTLLSAVEKTDVQKQFRDKVIQND